ncbi:MAG: hypothetical protein KJ057_14935 [Phycisphaerae bacterium]|nr:MAG: hypothetical protein EDS66_09620 [Planctomycetota bacterium]KAB2949185.1 MAG: hypothetical protein F9K17_03870 [Phycisphaerae bacterium]MBE7458701.1 hypothetical protein [Planctomycetia bacterium]MCK6466023.1 hypothetical protein [Phycisphaerae bacterium]MCL4719763.1 hypothetical protein [Phycisphaerae bacterium]
MRKRRAIRSGGFVFVIAAVTGLLPASCRQLSRDRTPGVDPQADRLRRHYPQLHEGRFSVIADFESPEHAAIVTAINASGEAFAREADHAGQATTGDRALQCRLASVQDAIVFSGEASAVWTLKRDWRGFDLLMMSVRASRPSNLMIELRGGRAESARRYTATVTLEAGWNTIELDVFAPGAALPLDDVRELRLRAAAEDVPLELTLDDVLLTADRRPILASRADVGGKLFLEKQGHRLNVGVSGRFEWTFDRGRLVAWYDLAADPNRLRNLSAGNPLGPTPSGNADLSAVLAAQPEGFQEILEHSPVRIRLRTGAFAPTPAVPASRRVAWEVTYTFYASAQVYVAATRLDPTMDIAGWRLPGNNVGWTATEPLEVEVGEVGALADRVTCLLISPRPEGSASVLVVGRNAVGPAEPAEKTRVAQPHLPGAVPEVSDIVAAPSEFLFHASPDDPDRRVFLHFAWMTPQDTGDAPARARDFLNPQRLAPLQGKVEPLTLGGAPGLPDPARGACRLAPDGGAVRFEIDGRSTPRYYSAFEVSAARGETCWVYVGHRLLDPVESLTDGTRLFQVPTVVRGLTPVEVLFAPSTPP